MPTLVNEVKPNYTRDALQAKIQGVVELECVVLVDGTVGDVRVVGSLDKTYGLDEQAVEAAKKWRFKPGTKDGKPVPVLIHLEMSFALRK